MRNRRLRGGGHTKRLNSARRKSGGEVAESETLQNACNASECASAAKNSDAGAHSGLWRHATSSSAMPGVEEPAVWMMIL